MGDREIRDYRSLGEILREKREKLELSIEDVADKTKISPRMIRALEADDVDQFDSPVYARGFVREMARALGLDVDWLLTKLDVPEPATKKPVLPETPKFPDPAPSTSAKPEPEAAPVWEVESVRVRRLAPETSSGGSGRRVAIVAVVVIAVAAGVWWFFGRGGADTAEPRTSERTAIVSETPPPETARTTPTASDPPADDDVTEDAGTGGPDPEAVEPEGSGTDAEIEAPTELARSLPPMDQREWHPSTAPTPASDGPETTPDVAATSAGDDRAAETDEAANDDETPAESATDDPPARESVERPVRTTIPPPAPARSEVVGDDGGERGLPSVVRGGTDVDAPRLTLVITARERVEVDVGVKGERSRRVLSAGETWTVTGVDHFSIRASDPDAADFELDGIVHEPPSQWTGDEWILYPQRESRPER